MDCKALLYLSSHTYCLVCVVELSSRAIRLQSSGSHAFMSLYLSICIGIRPRACNAYYADIARCTELYRFRDVEDPNMQIYIYIYTNSDIYIQRDIEMYICIYPDMYVYVYLYIYICVYVCTDIYIYIDAYTCVFKCTYVSIYISIYIYMYTNVCLQVNLC